MCKRELPKAKENIQLFLPLVISISSHFAAGLMLLNAFHVHGELCKVHVVIQTPGMYETENKLHTTYHRCLRNPVD